MKRFLPDFPDSLVGLRLETLDSDPNTIYGLTRGLTLSYFNPAWFIFSSVNGGEPAISDRFPLGTPIADALSGTAREFYLAAFEAVLGTRKHWCLDYECSSAELFRKFHQTVYPLQNGSGLVVVNSLVEEHPHDPSRVAHDPVLALYTQDTGFINQCSNCRRVQRVTDPEIWDWVPVWVERCPENTSHTFCRVCFEYYYLRLKPEM